LASVTQLWFKNGASRGVRPEFPGVGAERVEFRCEGFF
jgi:hypothetical protein